MDVFFCYYWKGDKLVSQTSSQPTSAIDMQCCLMIRLEYTAVLHLKLLDKKENDLPQKLDNTNFEPFLPLA